MLNPLIRWEPGTPVRYQLLDERGDVVVSCVRARSIAPA